MEATPTALPATGLVSSAPGFLFGLTNVQLCCVWQLHVWTGLANISNLILEPRSPDLSFSRNGGSVRTTPWCSRDFYCPYVFQVWQDQPELIWQESILSSRAPPPWHWSSTTHSVADWERGLRVSCCTRWDLTDFICQIFSFSWKARFEFLDWPLTITSASYLFDLFSAFSRAWSDPHPSEARQERLYPVGGW